jgi:hypothetical protein
MLKMNGQFVEVTFNQNIVITTDGATFGSGCSFADFNMDGWPDLSVTRYQNAPKFYINNQGQFSETQVGIPNWGNTDQKAILWADYDNDGDRDLLISPNYQPVRLYRNDGDLESLVNVTEEAGIASQSVRNYGASWVDYDRDGFLDLYICKYHNPVFSQGYEFTNHLYRNQGDGTFQDMTLFAGVGDGIKASFQSLFFDYNNDLWPDLYVINDRVIAANSLYINNGDGTFTDVSVGSGTNIYIDSMCGNAGDFDHDGDLDIYVTNSLAPHQFLINNGDGTFTDEAVARGIDLQDVGWGSLWIDYQNDTWKDLFVSSTGYLGTTLLQNHFFNSLSGEVFVDFIEETNIEGDLDATYSVVMADYDRDGWVDYFTHNSEQSASSLWRNVTSNNSSNSWLQIDLQGTISNRDGIGTWIEVYVDGDLLTQYTTCGYNYISQDSFTQHFGLGEAFLADSICIKWPSGLVENYYDVSANQHLQLIEGATVNASLNISGTNSICLGDSLSLTLNENYEFTWSNGFIGDTLIADTSGVYFAMCATLEGFPFTSDSLFLNVIPATQLQATTTDALCNGNSDGTATIVIEGGIPPYQIDWQGFEPDSLPAGIYEIVIEDDFDCTNQIVFIIEQPEQIVLVAENSQILDANCDSPEYNSGYVTISGGIEPYSIVWTFNSPAFSEPILIEGESYDCIPNAQDLMFELSVIDANGCATNQQGELDFFVGIHNLNFIETKIYPNPVQDQLYISGGDFTTLKIYNSQGQLLISQSISTSYWPNSIALDALSPGLYYLELGNRLSSHIMRFIKQ